MANMIRMASEEMYGYAREFSECVTNISAQRTQIEALLKEVESKLSGDEMDAHINKIMCDLAAMDNLYMDLISLTKFIKQAAQAVEQSEALITSTFDSFL